MSDQIKTTCLPIPNNNPLQLVADLHVEVNASHVPERHIIIEVQILGINCTDTIVFFKAVPVIGSCKTKTNGLIGELISPMPNSKSCFYKLPVECRVAGNEGLCKFDGFFAVNNTAAATVEICEVQQG